MHPVFKAYPAIFFFILLSWGCAAGRQQQTLQPLLTSDARMPLVFTDDGDRQSLLACARTHRAYLAGLPADYRTTIAGTSYPLSWLQLSLDEFTALLKKNPDPRQFSDRLKENFIVIEAGAKRGTAGGKLLVTGYYQPLFAGSLKRTGLYRYPLYTVPPSLLVRKEPGTGATRVGRLDRKGIFRPFWSRREIETSQSLAGNELVYLKDPFDAFLLHVQGSGKILLPDGSVRSVRFAGHNGRPYKSIGRLLVDEGRLSLAQSSIPAIRRYLDTHPEEILRVLDYNPRYIFFAWGKGRDPRGSMGQELTPGRSIAIDRKALPDALVGWLETTMPVVDETGNIQRRETTRRFVLPQDSGAAIKGPGRVDLYLGSGPDAAAKAGYMRETGRLLLFIKKGYTGSH